LIPASLSATKLDLKVIWCFKAYYFGIQVKMFFRITFYDYFSIMVDDGERAKITKLFSIKDYNYFMSRSFNQKNIGDINYFLLALDN